VLAASSLKGTFTQLGKQFEAAHPGDTVKFSFGASSALAPRSTAARFYSTCSPPASTKNMDQVVTPGNASNPQNFAKNIMEVAVPPNNPAKVTRSTTWRSRRSRRRCASRRCRAEWWPRRSSRTPRSPSSR
jgi:molybdate transport system substrate-binding protein